jgi:hypothetical protein
MRHKGFFRHLTSKIKMDAIIASIHHHLFRRLNVFLMSCSPAELIYASIQHYKFQLNLLYLQTVKKSNHLPCRIADSTSPSASGDKIPSKTNLLSTSYKTETLA